jgi:hypothetical protein
MLNGVGPDLFFVDILSPNPTIFSRLIDLVQILW